MIVNLKLFREDQDIHLNHGEEERMIFMEIRYNSKITEEVTGVWELQSQIFSSPYSFPWGPKLSKLNLYREDDYVKWRNFVNLGNQSLNYYQASTGDASRSWKSKFLNPNFVYLGSGTILTCDICGRR